MRSKAGGGEGEGECMGARVVCLGDGDWVSGMEVGGSWTVSDGGGGVWLFFGGGVVCCGSGDCGGVGLEVIATSGTLASTVGSTTNTKTTSGIVARDFGLTI